MKNLTILFILLLISGTMQSQSLTENEITGTWQVREIVDAGDQPKQAEEMIAAYFDLYSDHSFQLRMKMKGNNSNKYQDTFQNATWNFDVEKQIVALNNGELSFKVSKENDRIFFELPQTDLKLEVYKPM